MTIATPARAAVVKSRTPQPQPTCEAIEVTARAALRESAYDPVRRVECAMRDGAVLLSGRVPSFYLKQIAQSVVSRRLNGAAAIENRIEVACSE